MTSVVLPGAEPWSVEGSGALGVLCLHGFTGNPSSMRGVAETFAAAGAHVELPRLPGHGTSLDDMMPTRWADWAAEADAAYERLARRASVIVVAGLSMGGTLALRVASDRRATATGPGVAGLVLVNPAVEPYAIELVEMVEGMLADGEETIPGVGGDIADPTQQEIGYDEVPLAALLSFAVDGIAAVAAHYPQITVPLLLFTSRNDHVVDPATADYLVANYGGTVQRHELLRSYHVATQDYDREFIFTESLAFASTLAAAGR
jgi:carboxylesterase